jgi:hypothetical protein
VDNLLSHEEVKRFLEVEDGQMDHLIRLGKLHAYKIGGTYLRFRKDEVLTIKQEFHSNKKTGVSIPWFLRMRDFWRFNNFYILSLFLIAILFFIALRF